MQTGESLKEEPGLWFTNTLKVVCNFNCIHMSMLSKENLIWGSIESCIYVYIYIHIHIYIYMSSCPLPTCRKGGLSYNKHYADIIACTQELISKATCRVQCATFTVVTACGRNYAVSHSLGLKQYIQTEMDDLLVKQWVCGLTRNLLACMVDMATEPYQYGGSR